MPKRIRKKHRKKTSNKSILASVLASKNLPKTHRNQKKTPRKATLNGACFATLCNPRQSRRKLTGIIAFGRPNWLRIWLGLLHWSAPRRPNHRSQSFNLKCFMNVCPPKNLEQEIQKSFQSLPQIHPKSPEIAPKSFLKSYGNPKRVPNPSRTRFFGIFNNFLKLPGLSKSIQNRQNPKKKTC